MPANRLSILAKHRDQARLRAERGLPPERLPETKIESRETIRPATDPGMLARFSAYECRPN